MENRLKELENFINCVENTDKNIDDMIMSVGWTMESTKNSEKVLECPFDSSHQLSEKKLKSHLEYCQWKAEGYGKWDLPLSEPTIPFDVYSSIKFDVQILEKVLQQAKSTTPTMQIGEGNRLLPRTSNRIFSDLTSDERKAVYEYVITQTLKPNVDEDISNLNKLKEDNTKSSYLELLAHERDLKRRRAKHRGVHTNKKSQVEILREVINQQMEILKEHLIVRRKSDNQKNNVLNKNANESCISDSTTIDKCIDKSRIIPKKNTEKKYSDSNMHNYNNFYQHHNSSKCNRGYNDKKDYFCDDKEKKSSKTYPSYHAHNLKYSYKSSKEHDKNQEHFPSNKHKQFNNIKYDDEQGKYNNKSMRNNNIQEHNKFRNYEILKYSTKIKRRCETSTNTKN